MRSRMWGGMGGRTSTLALTVLGFAALIGACGDRVAEEEMEPAEDMELALEQEAEPELADVADEAPAEPEPVRQAAPTPPPPPPPAAAPRAETPPPATESPVRRIPVEATDPEPEELPPPEPEMVAITASAGSEMEAELMQELSTKTNQPGDRFELRVTTPLVDGNRVIVQRNSYISGRVTAVQRSGGQGQEAIIKVELDELSMLGESWPISATVVEAEPETEGRYTTGDKAARIGAGAVAGAILGRVIGGNSKGTVVGAAVGAAAGTAITLATEDVDAVLPEGSILRLRLDQPLTIMVPAG